MKILFLDESGDHNLEVIDPTYPIFVLGGVIMDKDYAEKELPQAMDTFKIRVFGNKDIILHTSDIARNRNGFEGLVEQKFRETFYQELNVLIRNLQFTVVACVVKKDMHLSQYGLVALDPRSKAGEWRGYGLVVLPKSNKLSPIKKPTPATQ